MRRGDRLSSERELASRFDVSRQTVREALVALEVAGIVEIRLGSGVYVRSTTVTEAHPGYEDEPGPLEILEARKSFEGEAAALAAERIGNEELQQLQSRLRLMREAAEKGDTEQTEDHDRRFHLAIAEASRNSAVHSTVDRLWRLRSKSEISRSFHARAREQGSKPNIADHERILRALVRREPEAARDAMRTHIGRVYDEFSRFSLA
ncbi:MAG: FCD domain-containing protein [Proteobacteria bacterium]|nr:FCD domain-containing protein [Pseudomonadota bacterium]